jgi:hypothetical protein
MPFVWPCAGKPGPARIAAETEQDPMHQNGGRPGARPGVDFRQNPMHLYAERFRPWRAPGTALIYLRVFKLSAG